MKIHVLKCIRRGKTAALEPYPKEDVHCEIILQESENIGLIESLANNMNIVRTII